MSTPSLLRPEGVAERLSERIGHHLRAARAAARSAEDPETTALWEHLQREARTGKQLRPRLLLRCAALLGEDHRQDGRPSGRTDQGGVGAEGTESSVRQTQLLDAACAAELLHQAFLLHDDVIDGDLARRGAPNVQGAFAERAARAGTAPVPARGYGRAAAILAGDLLLAEAHQVLARLDLPHATRLLVLDALRAAVADSAGGELADARLGLAATPLAGAAHEEAPQEDAPHEEALPEGASSSAAQPEERGGAGDPDEARVLRVLEQKTAAYSFRLPLVLAAAVSGRAAGQIEALARAGTRLGLIYQIRDDVLGTFGDPERTGKSVTSDLREGKLTLLVLRARTHPDWPAASTGFGRGDLSEAQAAGLREVIVRSGALDRAQELGRSQRDGLAEDLERTDLPPALVLDLLDLADYAHRRDA